jgi:hypothetical protein
MPRSGKAWVPEMRKRFQDRLEAGKVAERLFDHILNEDGDLMTPSQVNAAKIVLGKVLPDLKATEITGAEGRDLFSSIKREIVDRAKD